MDSKSSVLIVVGGVSGLFAAFKLVQNGITNVTILEAADRLGGRIHTVSLDGGGVLDMGAQEVVGRGDNPLWKFLVEHDIPVSDDCVNCDGVFYLQGGIVVEKKILKETLKVLDKIYDNLTELSRDNLSELASGNLRKTKLPPSVGQFFEDRFYEFIEKLDEDEESIAIRLGIFFWFKKKQLQDSGVDDWKDWSIKSWGEYTSYDSDSSSDSESDSDSEGKSDDSGPILKDGYHQLITFLLRQLEGKIRILTNQTVEQIKWGEDKVTINTEEGDMFTSSYVILTISLGVLKYNHQAIFNPPLPDSKIEAIEMMGMGLLNKIFLEFDEIFWNGTDPGIQLVQTSPNVEDDISLTWTNQIAGFDKVVDQPTMLGVHIYGPAARHIETLTEQQVLMKCWELLKQYVGPSVPKPISCTTSSWNNNKYTRGSYSHRPPTCDKVKIGPWSLAKPVTNKQGEPQLLFSGEATDRHCYGTVTGAMMAGIREGERLTKIIDDKERI